MYLILVIDLSECCFAKVYSDGEIEVIFKHNSTVPNKHGKGGQSAARFSRIRDNEITSWFKRINEYLKVVTGDIHLGMSSIYFKRFYDTLSTYNQQKIRERLSSEYSDLSGIYQMVSQLEARKH